MTPTHISLGYLIAMRLTSGNIPPETIRTVMTVSMIASVAPDLDILQVWKLMRHRESVLHKPLFWVVVFGFVYAYFHITGKIELSIYTIIAAINVLVHLIVDTFSLNRGIVWFWPFNKKEINLIRIHPPKGFAAMAKVTIRHPLTYVEIGIWAIALIVHYRYGML